MGVFSVEKQTRRDLKMSGTGTSSGGVFDKVNILGECDIDGDIECDKFKAMGTANVRGNMRAGSVRIVGTVDVDGKLEAEQVKVTGELNVKGDCSAESIHLRGAFSIDGLLNAGTVDIRLYGPANAKEIGGGFIRVRPHLRMFSGGKELSVDTVEGDDIHLEYTTAKVVRGSTVYIGPGCDIALVEFQKEFKQYPKAKVTESNKV